MSSLSPETLKQRVLRAGGWSVVGFGLSQVIRLGSSLFMTRLLVPEMFGVMAIASMVTVIIWLLSDIGLSQNIVQSRRGDDPIFLDTAWVVQIVRGIVLWLIALLVSVALFAANVWGLLPATSVYTSPVLPAIIAVSSFAVIIQSFQSTRMATAYRTLSQRRLTQIELISQIAGVVVMVISGVLTRSIWALVAGGMVAALMKTLLSHYWMSGHRNRFRWEKNALQELIHFGKWIFVSSAVGVLAVNGDRLLLGGLVDAHVLGLYAIAVLIVGSIESGINRILSTVSLPALSEILRIDPSRLGEVYYKLRIPSDLVLLFTAGLLMAAGQLVIDLLYDSRYSAAGSMVQVLALTLFTARYDVAQQAYLAAGKPGFLAIINIVRVVSLYALVPALYWVAGLQGAIWGVAAHALVTVPFVYYFNATLGLNDWRRELMVLVALPAGYLCGATFNLVRG